MQLELHFKYFILRSLGNTDKRSEEEAKFTFKFTLKRQSKFDIVSGIICAFQYLAVFLRYHKSPFQEEKSTLLKSQFPRKLQTHHVHDLHEAESEMDSERLGIICNWSLQRVVIFQQLLVKLPLELSLQGLFEHRNKQINNQDSISESKARTYVLFLLSDIMYLLFYLLHSQKKCHCNSYSSVATTTKSYHKQITLSFHPSLERGKGIPSLIISWLARNDKF